LLFEQIRAIDMLR